MDTSQILKEMGLSRILRYSCGGVLLLLLVAIINLEFVESIIDSLGAMLTLFVILTVGTTIYVVHRHILGEIFLFPLTHHLHHGWDYVHGRTGVSSTSAVGYLGALGVKGGDRRAAYTAVRRQFFNPADRENLDVVHSELHILYITAEETMLTSIYLMLNGIYSLELGIPSYFLFVIGITIGISAIIADIKQHQLECHTLKIKDREKKLRPFLKEVDYLK